MANPWEKYQSGPWNKYKPDQPTQQQPDPQEASTMAQVGRGMMDVYQGAGQAALNLTDLFKNINDKIDARIQGPKENALAKAGINTIASFMGLKPFEMASAIQPKGYAEIYNKNLANELKLYDKNNPGFQLPRLLGNLATPLTFIPGAGETLPARSAIGSGMGAIYSIAQPVTEPNYFAGKGKQVAFGATVGAAVPFATALVGKLGSIVDEVTKPLYKSGIYRDVAKFLKDFIPENRAKIIQALKNPANKGKTVGQVISEATQGSGDNFGGKLVKLEQDLSKESDVLKSLYDRQAAGRKALIDGISGTPEDYASAVARRETNAANNYGQSFQEGLLKVVPEGQTVASALESRNGGLDFLSNKYGRLAVKTAKEIISTNENPPQSNLTEFYHYVKEGLDKQINKIGEGALSNAEKTAANNVKAKLMAWLENKNQLYKAARLQYQADSAPINRMDIGNELKNAFMNDLGSEKPATFAKAIANVPKLIKTALGSPRLKKLTDVLSPDEIKGLGQIKRELITQANAKKMAGESASILSNLPGQVEVDLPHILSRPIVMSNYLMKLLARNKSSDYKQLLAQLMTSPDKFLKAYGRTDAKSQMAQDIVNRLNTIIASQAGAKNISNISNSIPGVNNGNQVQQH